MQETINDIIREMRLGHTINVDGGAYLIGYADTPPDPVHPIATYNIHRVTVTELADRLERATERTNAILRRIAHYCDDPRKMDDPYSADAHTLAQLAQLALGGRNDYDKSSSRDRRAVL